MADDLELAESLVREAGTLAAAMLSHGLSTHHKSSISDVVSAADTAAETMITNRLRRQRPDDGLIGEEGSKHPGERTWFIDPVDGTYNFLALLPLWCSAVALTDATGLVLGAIYHPATAGVAPVDQGLAGGGELWLGGRDHATTRNGTEVAPLSPKPLAEICLATYLHPPRFSEPRVLDAWQRAVGAAATVRMLGSGSVELAAVAAGRLGAWLHLDCPDWDWLPGRALVEAAGGCTAVLDAHDHRWFLAGNTLAVQELTALVQDN